MGFWNKKSNYQEIKKDSNFISIYNKQTRLMENIKLSDYVNSYFEVMELINEEPSLHDKKLLNTTKEEVTKATNLANVTDEETERKAQIKKLYGYLKELQHEQDKSEGK